jgi:hypothetical protein
MLTPRTSDLSQKWHLLIGTNIINYVLRNDFDLKAFLKIYRHI